MHQKSTNNTAPLDFERRCQKPDHRHVGNWMARRVSRPMALRVTRVLVHTRITAHHATLLAWTCGIGAAACFGWGNLTGWIFGAGLLQLWYLLDHVDGQLARYRGTASLDGVQLDYLMHHTINLLVPLGIGWGLAAGTLQPWWGLLGVIWGVSLLLAGVQHDTRYKAFNQRLKRLHGTLHVVGGGGGRPQPTSPPPRGVLSRTAWLARKACETHVVMNLLSALALGQLIFGDHHLLAARLYTATMAPLALVLTVATIARSMRRQTAEQEFAAWYRVPDRAKLEFRDGWWHVE